MGFSLVAVGFFDAQFVVNGGSNLHMLGVLGQGGRVIGTKKIHIADVALHLPL